MNTPLAQGVNKQNMSTRSVLTSGGNRTYSTVANNEPVCALLGNGLHNFELIDSSEVALTAYHPIAT